MSEEEQISKQEAAKESQNPSPAPKGKLKYKPGYWIIFVVLGCAIVVVERLLFDGTLVLILGPIVAFLFAGTIASLIFPPVKK